MLTNESNAHDRYTPGLDPYAGTRFAMQPPLFLEPDPWPVPPCSVLENPWHAPTTSSFVEELEGADVWAEGT